MLNFNLIVLPMGVLMVRCELVNLHHVEEVFQGNKDYEDQDEDADDTVSNLPLSSSSHWWLCLCLHLFLSWCLATIEIGLAVVDTHTTFQK